MNLEKMIEFLDWNHLPPEFLSSVIALLILLVFAIVVHFKIKSYDPLKAPQGIVYAMEEASNFADKHVAQLMGPAFTGFGGYVLVLGAYIMIGFILGFVGLPNVLQPGNSDYFLSPLPNPFTNTAMPLSIALLTFLWAHYTSVRCLKWKYFRRFVRPIPVFLPINMITMWSPVLSMTLRLFGNALAGYCIVALVYTGFEFAFPTVGAGLALTPLLTPIIHLYFDLFDGFIQLTVFCMLTMINIASEYVSPEQLVMEKQEAEEKRQARLKRREDRKRRKAEKLAAEAKN